MRLLGMRSAAAMPAWPNSWMSTAAKITRDEDQRAGQRLGAAAQQRGADHVRGQQQERRFDDDGGAGERADAKAASVRPRP